jgi:anti-sigma factor RsiW
MNSLLQQLNSNETILLMYLANELPADDRAEVEAMLSRETQFAGQFAQLRRDLDAANVAVAGADAHTPLPSSFAAARAFGDHVRHTRTAQRTIDENAPGMRVTRRWVIYPLASAAVILIGMVLWWGLSKDELNAWPAPELAVMTDVDAHDDTESTDASIIASAVAAGPIEAMDDEQLLAIFEPVIQPAVIDAQDDYSALIYFNETLQ